MILTLMATSSSSSRMLAAPQGCPNKLPVLLSSCEGNNFNLLRSTIYTAAACDVTHRRCIQLSAVMLHKYETTPRIVTLNAGEVTPRYLKPRQCKNALGQWIPRDPQPFPGDPLIHFCNAYFELTYSLIKRIMFF